MSHGLERCSVTTETNFCSVEKQGGSVWQTRPICTWVDIRIDSASYLLNFGCCEALSGHH